MKIVFLIRSLARGGAERQLSILARGLVNRGHDVTVAVFYEGGDLESELIGTDVTVSDLGKRSRWDNFRPFVRFVSNLRKHHPDIIHGYMDVSNIACLLAKPFVPGVSVVWGVRSSTMDYREYHWLRKASFRAEIELARFPDLIIANSDAGRLHRIEKGFPRKKTTMIPNGIEIDRFQPDPIAGSKRRAMWGIPENALVIGHVARMDPKKDHGTLLRALSGLDSVDQEWHLVCISDGSKSRQSELKQQAANLNISERTTWLASEDNMPAAYNAFDIFVSSSAFGEGFPNVIGEAMACGVPCVVTDVGDSARVVGETGIVVPPNRPETLCNGIQRMMKKVVKESGLGNRARERIAGHFDSERLVDRTIEVLSEIS